LAVPPGVNLTVIVHEALIAKVALPVEQVFPVIA
jgi:hypothetical protein